MDVASCSDAEILDMARKEIGKNLADDERSKLQFQMDTNSTKSYIAVVIEFGSDGAVIVNGKIMVGEKSNKELHFTSSTRQFSGSPQIYYIHQE
ncbi:uncharacterized protein P884DRAFT_192844 [Thermothelomyces heterothallicus CBS 202.75]|uniref:uncharacterized protein n=1 Tax=Thermothelomyces heterothallicus CBS 202.75 TaxID=1149848 RepID=UPI0037436113